MSIFKEIAEILYEASQESLNWDEKVSKYKEEQRNRDIIIQQENKKLKEAKERRYRELYWEQYWNDPDSVKILPYGWSPFGFYL